MTREEAKHRLLNIERCTPIHTREDVRDFEALEIAIKALEQEQTTKNDLGVDAVNREAVLDLIADYDLSMGQVVKGIHALPSVTPQEQKTGHWIAGVNGHFNCSECNTDFFAFRDIRAAFIYCPYCGARMVDE